MTRQVNKRLNEREQVDTSIEQSSTAVAPQSTPVYRESGATRLANSLKGFAPAVAKYQNHMDEKDTLDAASFYAAQGEHAPTSLDDFAESEVSDKSIAWRKAYMGLIADASTKSIPNDLLEEYLQTEKDVNFDITDWFARKSSEAMGGVEDPLMQRSLLKALDKASSVIFKKHYSDNLEEVSNDIGAASYEVLSAGINDGSISDVASLHKEISRQRILGVSEADQRRHVVEAVIAKGDPALFDMLMEKMPDGSPSIYAYDDIRGAIDSGKAKAIRDLEVGAVEADDEYTRSTELDIVKRSESGVLTEAYLNNLKKDPRIDPKMIHRHHVALLKNQRDDIQGSIDYMRYVSGDFGLTPDAKKKQSKIFMQKRQEANPEGWINDVIRHDIEVIGELSAPIKAVLEGVNPNNQRFEEAVNYYKAYAGTNKNWIESQISEEKSFMFDMYVSMERIGGKTHDQIAEVMKNTFTRENYQEAMRTFQWRGDDSETMDAAKEIARPWFGSNSEDNLPYMARTLQRLAAHHSSIANMYGSVPVEDSIEWAKTRMAATHHPVNGKVIYVGDLKRKQGWTDDMFDELGDHINKVLKEFPEGTYIIPDDTTMVSAKHSWGVYDATGYPTGQRMAPFEVLKLSREKQRKELTEQIQQQADNKLMPTHRPLLEAEAQRLTEETKRKTRYGILEEEVKALDEKINGLQ